MELGDALGPQRRMGPDTAQVAAYMNASEGRERLFVDSTYARGLGFRGTIVPGPMLSAFLEQFVRAQLPGWRLERLSVTFRVPTIATEALLIRGAVTEHHQTVEGELLVCDLWIEHNDGERGVTGVATLRQPASA